MPTELLSAIHKLRNAIRQHRDQRGDDRCWLDDYRVWELLSDSPAYPKTLPPITEAMMCCRAFFQYRQSTTVDPLPSNAQIDPQQWDSDLNTMNQAELQHTLSTLQAAIRCHRDIKDRPRTITDDRKLYSTLPEKLPADFRLPPAELFLGEQQAKVGCPAFWKSHQNCPTNPEHDLHRWGPCYMNQSSTSA